MKTDLAHSLGINRIVRPPSPASLESTLPPAVSILADNPTTDPSGTPCASSGSHRMFTTAGILPMTFNLHGLLDTRAPVESMITIGGGTLLAPHSAQIVVLPLGADEPAILPFHVEHIRQLQNEAGRVAVSHEWILNCVTQDRLMPLEGYTIDLAEGPAKLKSPSPPARTTEHEGTYDAGESVGLPLSVLGTGEDQEIELEGLARNQVPTPEAKVAVPTADTECDIPKVDQLHSYEVDCLVDGLQMWDTKSGWEGLLYALCISSDMEEQMCQLKYLGSLLTSYEVILRRNVPGLDVGHLKQLWASNVKA
ncbi:hypothetical protein IAT38_005870 [Cryptococcus sp. DSM 104549]